MSWFKRKKEDRYSKSYYNPIVEDKSFKPTKEYTESKERERQLFSLSSQGMDVSESIRAERIIQTGIEIKQQF